MFLFFFQAEDGIRDWQEEDLQCQSKETHVIRASIIKFQYKCPSRNSITYFGVSLVLSCTAAEEVIYAVYFKLYARSKIFHLEKMFILKFVDVLDDGSFLSIWTVHLDDLSDHKKLKRHFVLIKGSVILKRYVE